MGKAMVAGVAASAAGVAAVSTVLYQTGKTFDDVNNTIRVGTGATGEALDELNGIARNVGQNVPAEWDKIADTVADLNTRLGLSGDTLDTVAQQYLEAGRVLDEDVDIDRTSAAFNAFKIEGEDVSGAMDHLFRVSQATGVGMNDLADQTATNSAVAQQLGWSFEETTGLIGSLDKAGLNSTSMMSGLSRSLANLAEDGEEPADAFNRVTDEISGFLEEGDKASAMDLASDAFGTRNAAQFIQALEDGTLNMAELGEVAGMTDDTIMQAGEETKQFGEQWQLFKNNVMVWLEPLATQVFGAINDAIENGVEWTQQFIEAWQGGDVEGTFGDLGESVRGAWERLKDFGQWISDNRGPISGFASVIGGMVVTFGLYRGALATVAAAKTALTIAQRGLNTAMRANPIGLIITAVGGLVAGLTWLFTQTESGQKIWETVWDAIKSATSAVVDWFTETAMPWLLDAWDAVVAGFSWAWENVLKPVWDALASTVTWVWEAIIEPIFGLISAAWELLVTGIQWYWENILSPVFNLVGDILTWLWEEIAMPVFGFIGDAWASLVDGIKWYWENVLSPVIELVGDILGWLWENVARPVFDNIGDSWATMIDGIVWAWENLLSPAWDAVSDAAMWMWENALKPAFDWISDAWDGMVDGITWVWENLLKPVFEAVGDFVMNDVVGMVESGVDMIGDAWNAVANFFREPINWVINTVWNDGIAGAFDAVSKAVGSDTRMAKIPNIGRFGASSGSRGNVPGYAKGGLADRGWALVGEEGPELVNFSQPGRVYTADETHDALTGAPGGIGDPWYSNSELELGKQAGRDAVGGALADAWDWVRGKLADGVSHVVQPLLGKLGEQVANDGTMGQLGIGLADWGFNSVLDWARGKDEEAIAGGQYDGEFTANPGGFNRPAQGMITSMAGTRSYWGAFGNQHYGVDIANSVGSVIRAAWDGVVKRTFGGGLDRTMILNHGNFDTAYLHNSGFLATPGQEVSGGQPIARMGSAGTGPHLHFEMHPGGWYNPDVGGVNALFRDKGGLIYPGLNQVMNDTGKAEYAFNQQQFDNLNKIAASSSGGEGWQITQNNYQSNNQHRDAQDLRMTFRRERRKAGV